LDSPNSNLEEDGVLSNPETFGLEDAVEPQGFQQNSLAELHQMLGAAVEDEDYEKAARLRDEISKREP
jgi:excinuclease UvrABC helicase subunit UvrB